MQTICMCFMRVGSMMFYAIVPLQLNVLNFSVVN